MGNQLIADPFQIQVKKDVDFTVDVLERVFAMSDDWDNKNNSGSRWLDYSDSWLFLDNLKRHRTQDKRGRATQDYFLGSLLRARTEELPVQVGRNGVSPLQIPSDEGIGEHLAFLWDPERSMLWLQRERNVGRIALMYYLRSLSGNAAGIIPVFQSDAPARAKKVKDVKRIEFTYLIAEQSHSPRGFFSFINKLEGYGAARIEVRVKPVRGAYLDPSARQAVREIAEEVEQGTGIVEKAKVWGDISDDEANVFIDLLRQRGEFTTGISRQKSRDPGRLMQAVRNIWLTHRDEVEV